MRIPLISFRSLVTLTLSMACVILAVMWPGWFTSFRAEGTMSYSNDPAQISVSGNLAVSTATVQTTNISIRLASLRGGGAGSSGGGLALKLDEQSLPFGVATSLNHSFGNGGGASADPSRQATFGGLGLFLSGQGSFGDQQATSREPGFDFRSAGLTLGADYKLTNNLILGAAFGYLNTQADIHNSAGHLTTNGYSVSAFGTYYIANKMYVDAIATYGWNDYDIERNIAGLNETARGNPGGNQFAISVNSGYDFNFGALTAGPTLRVNYLRVYVDGFRESGAPTVNLTVNSQNPESVTTDLGGQVSYAISMPWGVLSPMLRFEWEHEYENGSRLIVGRLATNPATVVTATTNNPDRDYFNLGAGLTATFKGGTSAFFYYETVLGRSHFTYNSFTAGVRFEFD